MKALRLIQLIKGTDPNRIKYTPETHKLTILSHFLKPAYDKVLEVTMVRRLETEFPRIFGSELLHQNRINTEKRETAQ